MLTPVVSAVSSVFGGFNKQHEQLDSTKGQRKGLFGAECHLLKRVGDHCGSVVLMVDGLGGFK